MHDTMTGALIVRETGRHFDVAGAHLVWKARAEETGGAFCLFEQTLSPGESVPPHRHGYTEVFYVLAGTLRFEDATGTPHHCGAGQTVIAAPEVAHSFYNDGDEPVRLLSIAPAAHQSFFDAVEAADRTAPFAAMSPTDAMMRVGEIGAATDTRFEAAPAAG